MRSRLIAHALSQPAFVAAFVTMLVAAAGLNFAIPFLQLHFKKEPLEIRRQLGEIPLSMGPWLQVSVDQPLEHELEDVLGTKQYIFRDYLDTRLISASVLNDFNGKSAGERREQYSRIATTTPRAAVTLAVTYYTGMVDTVAHIPDRCYVLGGWEPSHSDAERWESLKGRRGDQQIRFITFEDQTPGRAPVAQNVAYFFNCNGDYVSDSLSVRLRLQKLTEKFGYYAKIEIMNLGRDRDQSAAVMNDFLSSALPQVESCMPDWDSAVRGVTAPGALPSTTPPATLPVAVRDGG